MSKETRIPYYSQPIKVMWSVNANVNSNSNAGVIAPFKSGSSVCVCVCEGGGGGGGGGSAIFFLLFLHENVCCGYSVEAPRWGTSNKHPYVFVEE